VPTHVALLRGVNLGRHNKVGMERLRGVFEGAGHADVATYVQSGNVVFTAADGTPGDVERALENAIAREVGLAVRVLVRDRQEMESIVAGNPLLAETAEGTKLHVTFLDSAPDPARVREIDPSRFAPDRCEVIGREVYLYCPNGYGRSPLANAYWERRLARAATTRNWNTVTRLAELVGSGGR
jgi:uncharacterized protein (DUF1697 family)